MKLKDILAIAVGLLGGLSLVFVDATAIHVTDTTRAILEGWAALTGPALGWGVRGALK